MGNQKKYGIAYERKEKKFLEGLGYKVFRVRGSFSKFDIVAYKEDHWLVEQVKSTKTGEANFNKELREFKNIKVPKGTIKWFTIYDRGLRNTILDKEYEPKTD